ncbi:GAP family protein [Mycolicibacterium sp. 120270]|uniref:GAP family protein n=1 Tax=Mycolicibacterium sp. 120270 TaxID=3090600 RepID=UPI00299DFA2A|nr:GAP family protein [Mycolicibacterium sp. 120270]MDX1885716.1 GAP family protein [Mycolicibacterium sp. 120270]
MLGELIPLALVVALSPVSIVPAVVLVLHTDRPRPTGLAFLAGWLIALAVTTAVFVRVPDLIDGFDESPPWGPWLRIGTAAAAAMSPIAVAFYTILAGSTVIAPVLAYVVAGHRVDSQLERVRDWMQREQAGVIAVVLLVVGVLLTYTGIRAL